MTNDTEHSISIPADRYGRVSGTEVARLMARAANIMTGDAEQDFAHTVAAEHRTLQQTMTGMMLTAIVVMANNADNRLVDDRNRASATVCQKIVRLLEDEGVYIADDHTVRFPLI